MGDHAGHPAGRVGQCLVDEEPSAEAMVRLAAEAFAAGEGEAPHRVQPVYLRDQVAWKKNR